MRVYLFPLVYLQRFIVPAVCLLALWAIYRMVAKKDVAVGLVLYIGLVVVVDGFMNTGLYLPGLEKGSIRFSELCAVYLIFNATWNVKPAPLHTSISRMMTLYFALLFVAALRAQPALAGIFEFRRLIVSQILAFTIARRGLDSTQAYRRFFRCLSGLVIFFGLFTFYDLFFDHTILKSDMLENGIYWHNRAHNRFGSFFLNPNYFAAFVVMVFPTIFVWTLGEKRQANRLFGAGAMLVLVFSLVETQSRAPLLAFGITLVMLIFGPSADLSRTRRTLFFGTFAVLFTLLMPGFLQHAMGRFNTIDTEMSADNGRSRETTWAYTARMIKDHPVLGIGFGEAQFMRYMDAYGFGDEFEGEQSLDAPHNSFLQVAVYAGLPALALFAVSNLLLFAKVARISLGRAPDGSSAFAFGLAVGLLGFLACVYTDLQLFTVTAAPGYWVCFGLLLSLGGGQPLERTAALAVAPESDAQSPSSWWTAHPPLAHPHGRSQIAAPTANRHKVNASVMAGSRGVSGRERRRTRMS